MELWTHSRISIIQEKCGLPIIEYAIADKNLEKWNEPHKTV